MDKFMDSPWFLKGISLLLALMLFMSVQIENTAEKKSTDTSGVTFVNETETITNVPIQLLYDSSAYVIESQSIENVDIELEGSNSLMKSTKVKGEYEVYADLQDLGEGTHQVSLEYKNISDQLKVSLDPTYINVVIKEKAAKNINIDVELANAEKIESGFEVGTVELSPSSVTVVGAKEIVERVASVKAQVDLEGANSEVTKQVKLVAYDENGNTLDLQIDPETAKVVVPVNSPNKTYPLTYELTGTLPDGVRLTDVKLSPEEVQVFGDYKTLNNITEILSVKVDISKITKNTTIDVDIPLPDGAIKINPTKVSVSIQVEEMEEEKYSDIPIEITGVPEGYEVEIVTPKSQTVTVTGKGYLSDLKNVSTDDFEAVLDVDGLEEGTHEVEYTIKGPSQIELSSDKITGKIKITKIED